MTIKSQKKNIQSQIEELHAKAVAKHKQNQLKDALSFYLQSIELDEFQSEWIYANAITISSLIGEYGIGKSLAQKANRIHANSHEVFRSFGILFHKLNNLTKAVESYQKSIALEPKQPEWVYVKLIELLTQLKMYSQAAKTQEAAIREFPQSEIINRQLEFNLSSKNTALNQLEQFTYSELEKQQFFQPDDFREVPKTIEDYLDLETDKLRRKLTDSAIVERYSILLEQLLCNVVEGNKEMNIDALVHCLAEIKTDIHYLKTKVIEPSPEAVDPQKKQNIELDKIIGLNKPILIKCELKERIVGTGWYDSEEHGRWNGPGVVSSVVLPYPVPGEYKLEIIVRGEAKQGLLKTLKVNLNDRPLVTSTSQKKSDSFPAVVVGELNITQEREQSFLAIDLIIDETVTPPDTDSRSIGLLVERISLIPNYSTSN